MCLWGNFWQICIWFSTPRKGSAFTGWSKGEFYFSSESPSFPLLDTAVLNLGPSYPESYSNHWCLDLDWIMVPTFICSQMYRLQIVQLPSSNSLLSQICNKSILIQVYLSYGFCFSKMSWLIQILYLILQMRKLKVIQSINGTYKIRTESYLILKYPLPWCQVGSH